MNFQPDPPFSFVVFSNTMFSLKRLSPIIFIVIIIIIHYFLIFSTCFEWFGLFWLPTDVIKSFLLFHQVSIDYAFKIKSITGVKCSKVLNKYLSCLIKEYHHPKKQNPIRNQKIDNLVQSSCFQLRISLFPACVWKLSFVLFCAIEITSRSIQKFAPDYTPMFSLYQKINFLRLDLTYFSRLMVWSFSFLIAQQWPGQELNQQPLEMKVI